MVAVRKELTRAEFSAIDAQGRFDLVDGVLWSMPPAKIPHGKYAAQVIIDLGIYLRANPIGTVYAGELGFVLDSSERTILCPDASFVRRERIPRPEDADFFPGAPDLAVEVISESERPREIQAKVARYLLAGTAIVWCIYPVQRQIVVYTDTETEPPHILGEGDTLDGGPLLPGFELPLKTLFS
jgi:Uma2 family endonuclease